MHRSKKPQRNRRRNKILLFNRYFKNLTDHPQQPAILKISYFITGIPEINFPGINEPINIDGISMKVEDTSLSGKLSSVGMRGLSKFIGKANAA